MGQTPYSEYLTDLARELVEAVKNEQSKLSCALDVLLWWRVGSALWPELAAALADDSPVPRLNCLLPYADAIRAAVREARAAQQSQVRVVDLLAAIWRDGGGHPNLAAAGAPTATMSDTAGEQAKPIPPERPTEVAFTPLAPGGTLKTYGKDLTAAALHGELPQVVGRQRELDLIVETLCRARKRNPVLVGPAGTGKTALAEGLAQRIALRRVPEPLLGKRVIAVTAGALMAGAGAVGETEKRVTNLLAEATRTQTIVFIDEFHTVIGAGSGQSNNDIANLLKPALARGEVAVIAATTDGEYRRYVQRDEALDRRFQPIRIQPMTREQTVEVLRSSIPALCMNQPIHVADGVLDWIVRFTDTYVTNRFFPDKALDLLEQSIAYVVSRGGSSVDHEVVDLVGRNMVGIPDRLDDRLADLPSRLVGLGYLDAAEAEDLRDRLAVSFRAMDLRPERPNAVVMLTGQACQAAQGLAECLAGCLLDDSQAVVNIDLQSGNDRHSVTSLLGAAPGYIGYSDTLPLHAVAQRPWCVLVLTGLESCCDQLRQVVATALESGYFTLADGKTVYLSSTVVVLTADVQSPVADCELGFRRSRKRPAGAARQRSMLADLLGPALMDQVDLLSSGARYSADHLRELLSNVLWPKWHTRMAEHGILVELDDGVLDWLMRKVTGAGVRQLQALFDTELSPRVVGHEPTPGEGVVRIALSVNAEGAIEARTL